MENASPIKPPLQAPSFTPRSMRLQKFSSVPDLAKQDALNAINSIRSNYQWSQRVYDFSLTDDVFLIACRGSSFGFVECEYLHTDLAIPDPPILYLHELQIAPSMQGKKVGFTVLEHLLGKGMRIRMEVVNENAAMLALVGKFNVSFPAIGNKTRSVLLTPGARETNPTLESPEST